VDPELAQGVLASKAVSKSQTPSIATVSLTPSGPASQPDRPRKARSSPRIRGDEQESDVEQVISLMRSPNERGTFPRMVLRKIVEQQLGSTFKDGSEDDRQHHGGDQRDAIYGIRPELGG